MREILNLGPILPILTIICHCGLYSIDSVTRQSKQRAKCLTNYQHADHIAKDMQQEDLEAR